MSAPGEGPPPPPSGGPFEPPFEVPAPAVLSPLPNGRHGLPRGFVEENHRNRIMAAALSCLARDGYQETTIGRIVAAAGVSNSTFYQHYADKAACVLAAYDIAVAWLEREMAAALAGAESWPGQVRAASARVLELLGADQRLARLVAIDVFFTGVRAEVRHRALVDRLALPLAAGRSERALGAELPPHLEPILIGGAFALVSRQLGAGEGPELAELAPELTEYLLGPYLGVAAARRVASGGG